MSCIWSGALGSHYTVLMTVAHRKITLVCGFVTSYALVIYKSTADGKILYKTLMLFA